MCGKQPLLQSFHFAAQSYVLVPVLVHEVLGQLEVIICILATIVEKRLKAGLLCALSGVDRLHRDFEIRDGPRTLR